MEETKELAIQTQHLPINYSPTTFTELMEWANLIKDSSLIPPSYRGKAADIVIAAQYGSEVGLKPMAALHGIATINGRPSLWGDALLAVCQNSPSYEWHKEEQTDEQAICIVKRRGATEHTSIFTKQDAIVAGLWGKAGPWKNSPKRMLQMRARGFAVRDQFSDALKGMCSAEEQRDIEFYKEPMKNITPRVTEDQIYQIKSYVKELNKTEEYIKMIITKKAGVSKLEDISPEFADEWIQSLCDQSWSVDSEGNQEVK